MANGDRKRRKWGCVVACKDADGSIVSWQARYQSPVNPRQRIYRRFGLEFQAEAYRWLDEEHALVIDHKKGIRKWTHPSARTMQGKVLFSSYATRYVADLRKRDGSELSGRSKRIQKAALDKLIPWFGGTPMRDITEEFVNEWYARACDEVRPSALEHAVWLLKRVMRAATGRQPDGGPPLLSSNPCNLVMRKRQSKRRDQAPMTKQEIDALVEGFPEYDRLSVHLALLVGGLRIGEVCGLQLRDIDLENLQLHVRHSVNRGTDDRGKYQLCEPKTKSSKRVVPIPKPLAPLIEAHISRFCKDRKPDTMLFHSPMLDDWLLPPTTIERTFRMAREKIGRPDITFHSLRATHATMLVLEGGTMRETMDDLGHTSLTVAVDSYQRVVREHHRDTVELLAYRYMPSNDPTVIRTVIDQKERQIDKLRDEVERLRKILLERDTGIPTDPDTVLPKNQNR